MDESNIVACVMEFLLIFLLNLMLVAKGFGGIFINLGMLGLLFAPFAGLICGFAARRRGLEFARYCIVGAVSCVFLVFPFVYLLLRLTGRNTPQALTAPVYIGLYALWTVTLAAGLGTTFLLSLDDETSLFALYVAGNIVGAGLLIVSLRMRAWRSQVGVSETDLSQAGFRALMTPLLRDPFAHAWVGYLVGNVDTIVGIIPFLLQS